VAFTEFCCRSGGSNLNAGSVDGGSTEPSVSPLVTYTGGDWNATTDIYTAPIGADMTDAQVGRFASLYVDGDTAPTTNRYLVARITAVNDGTRQITLSTTARALLGTEVTTGTGNRSMRIGGAWQGHNGANQFPFNFVSAALTDATINRPRVNYKNDATFAITAAMSHAVAGPIHWQGYATTYGDGGIAITDGGTTGASYVLFTLGNVAANHFVDLEWRNNGDSGSATGVVGGTTNSVSTEWKRCVFHSFRGTGLDVTGARDCVVRECELHACNQSNTAAKPALQAALSGHKIIRCMIHDNTGSNTQGARSGGGMWDGCIFSRNGSHGLVFTTNSTHDYVKNSDFYDNGGSGAKQEVIGASGALTIENCNFIKNAAYGLDLVAAMTLNAQLYNNGFGTGTQANASGAINQTVGTDVIEEEDTVTYPADVTPWVDPANGDFRINLSAAKGTGRGAYLQTASGYAGTVGYPDIGAAQHLEAASGSTIRRHFGGKFQRGV